VDPVEPAVAGGCLLVDEHGAFVELGLAVFGVDEFIGGGGEYGGRGGRSGGSGGGFCGGWVVSVEWSCEMRGDVWASWSLHVSFGHASDLHGPGTSRPWRIDA
jgi:hypothetical protein